MAAKVRRMLSDVREGEILITGAPRVIDQEIGLSVTRWGVTASVFVCGVAVRLPHIGALGRLDFPSAVLTGPEGRVTRSQLELLDAWPGLVPRCWASEVLSVWDGREDELRALMPAEDVREVLALGLTVQVMAS